MLTRMKDELSNACDGTTRLKLDETIVVEKEVMEEFVRQYFDLMRTFGVKTEEQYEKTVAGNDWGNNTCKLKTADLDLNISEQYQREPVTVLQTHSEDTYKGREKLCARRASKWLNFWTSLKLRIRKSRKVTAPSRNTDMKSLI